MATSIANHLLFWGGLLFSHIVIAMDPEEDRTFSMLRIGGNDEFVSYSPDDDRTDMRERALGHYNIGKSHSSQHNWVQAIEFYSSALNLEVDGVYALTGLSRVKALQDRGDAYRRQRKYQEAIADYDAFFGVLETVLTPSILVYKADVFYGRGYCYFQMKSYVTAIEDLTSFLDIKEYAIGRWRVKALLMRAMCYKQEQFYEESLDDYKEALEVKYNINSMDEGFVLIGERRKKYLLQIEYVKLYHVDEDESFTAEVDVNGEGL